MPIYRRASSSWTTIRNVYRRTSGSWVQINAVYRRAGGTWNRVFSRISVPSIQSTVAISKSTNGTTFLVTLTGTNYFWSQSPTSLSYKFQWSSDAGSSWSDISTGVATNPSSGSSNTYTYSVPTSEVSANVNNLYRFLVTATNAAGGATSTSSNLSYVEIQGPTDISDLSVTSTGATSASLSWTASTGASAYLLYYATTPPSYTLGQTVVGSTSGTVSGLSNSTLYYFRVLPITGTSNTYKGYSGNNSNVVTTTTTGPPVNTVAPSISPTSGTAGSTSYSVTNGTWTGSPTSYTYQWKSYDSPSYVNAPGSSTSSSYTPPSNFFTLGYFSPIKCVVTAINSAGSTSVDSSNTASVSAPAPQPPTITSSSSTSSSITLNFTAGANSTSTRAYLSGGFDGSTVGSSYTFSGLSANTAYTLALYGYNGTTLSSTSSGGSYSTTKIAALTPTFGSNTSVSGGFTGSVTNYDANYTWTISTNSGSVSFGSPSGGSRPFTVSGLSLGASATVTVNTSRTNYFDGSAQTTGTASSNVAPSGGSVSIAVTSGTTGRVGATHTATITNASGTPTPTSTRQWKRLANYSPFTVTNIGSGASTYVSTYDDVDCAIRCDVTFTNGISPDQIATSNSINVSPPSITGIGATRTNNTAPYVTWNIVGINIQSSQGTVLYGSTSPPTITSGTDPQANTALQRATSSRSGTSANYYRYNSVTAFSGTGQSGRSTATISTTTIVQANAAGTTTVYGTYP